MSEFKMEKEFNLSEKGNIIEGYKQEDVKEFIKRLKEKWKEQQKVTIENSGNPLLILDFRKAIDKLAGDKLI